MQVPRGKAREHILDAEFIDQLLRLALCVIGIDNRWHMAATINNRHCWYVTTTTVLVPGRWDNCGALLLVHAKVV